MKLSRKIWVFLIALVMVYYVGYSVFKGTSAVELPANPAFDDINFYKCVVDAYNEENDDSVSYSTSLSDEQLAKITSLSCNGAGKTDNKKIASVKGLEKLTALTVIDFNNNELANLDLSSNVKLTKLYLGNNQLTELDLSQNTLLTNLHLYDNQLTELDVSKNINLNYLSANNNQLVDVNVDNCTVLETLGLHVNQLADIDLSTNSNLKTLWLNNNNFSSVDVSNNTKLQTLKVSNNQLSNIELDHNIYLVYLNASNTQIENLDISENTSLKELYITNNKLNTIELNSNTSLEKLYIAGNQLTELDVSSNTALTYLDIGYWCISDTGGLNSCNNGNNIENIDLSKNTKLKDLYLSNNQISSLDVSNNTSLEKLYVDNNQLTGLDVSQNTALKTLFVNDNLYSETLYVYKGDNIILGNSVKIPSQLGWDNPMWTSGDENIINVSDDGKIIAKGVGTVLVKGVLESKYSITSIVNVVEITSDKYIVNNENSYIYVGSDNDSDTIMEDINKSNENISISVDKELNKLYVKYGEDILKEFTIVRLSSDKYDLSKDSIYIGNSDIDLSEINNINCDKEISDNKLIIKYGENVLKEYVLLNINFGNLTLEDKVLMLDDEISYDDFVKNITVSEGLTYKLFNGEEEITDGSVLTDMVLKIYYGSVVLDSFKINNYSLVINSSLKVDEVNKNITLERTGTVLSDFLKNIIVTGGNTSIVVMANNGGLKTDTDMVGTGDTLMIFVGDNKKDEYVLKVMGDTNGDGKLNGLDLVQLRKHIVEYKNPDTGIIEVKTGIYKDVLDISGDGIVNSLDIVRMRKRIVGLE